MQGFPRAEIDEIEGIEATEEFNEEIHSKSSHADELTDDLKHTVAL